ncbi:hypothetical protein NQ318_009943 [Aromia moschata]|uniref:Uncharacterized protein n=1 Tax=Aromia moschata TaxID=1265417 RepID=A0AAV8XWE3_9CUCU|nr:hypothetical protein NQ318_009943 [Aromia moschata]
MKLIQTAFKSRIASYRVHSENRYSDYNMFFESIKNKVIHLLSEVIKIHNAVKSTFCRLKKSLTTRASTQPIKVIDSAADLNDVFYVFVDLMTTQMSEFQKRDSGWELQFIICHLFIEKKKGIVNVHNQDQCCFLWAIISALHPVRERTLDVSSYPQFSTVLDIEGITFLLTYILWKVTSKNDKIVHRVVGPLYYSQKKLHICTYQFAANNHIRNISVMGAYYILVMKTYYFNINKMTVIIYIRQYRQDKLKKDKYGAYILEPNPHYSYTNRTFRHEPYSFAYLIKYSFNDSFSKFELYRGANAANVFVKKTENYLTRIYENYLKPIIPMEHLTREK